MDLNALAIRRTCAFITARPCDEEVYKRAFDAHAESLATTVLVRHHQNNWTFCSKMGYANDWLAELSPLCPSSSWIEHGALDEGLRAP